MVLFLFGLLAKRLRTKSGECPKTVEHKNSSILCPEVSKLTKVPEECEFDYACPAAEKCVRDIYRLLQLLFLFNSVFQCSNGCRSVCTAAIAQKVPITTTTPISVSSSFQCSAKSRLGSYFNCFFKRKQCSSDDECVQVSPGTRCCPTACGNECLGIL
jgi:hypothetical protein